MPGTLNQADARAAAKTALLQLFDPLTQFAIDVGLGVSEVNLMLRYAAVKCAATKQRAAGRRVNISGIAALTGISRSEISRVLKSNRKASESLKNLRRPSIYRILEAWHGQPRFMDAKGAALELRLYGRGATFESLVRTYGGGIPIRAMLDEMIRIRAVEVTAAQRVRVVNTSAINRAKDSQLIAALGNRASELISTMASNIRHNRCRHVSTIVSSMPNPAELALFQKNLTNISSTFISKLKQSLALVELPSAAQSSTTISVTFFSHLSTSKENPNHQLTVKRNNFRRSSASSKTTLRTLRKRGDKPRSRTNKRKP